MKVQLKFSEIVMLLVVSLMSLAASLPEHLLGNLADRNTLLITLAAFVVITVFHYPRMVLFIEICILAIGANLPEELASALGVSHLVLIASLGFLAVASLLGYAFKLLPPGTEESNTPIADARHSLLTAISEGDIATLYRLLAMNAEVNFTQDGSTPLHLAAEKGYSDIVQILIHHGADFRIRNAEGNTPLEIAVAKKKFIRTTERLSNANTHYFAKSGQAENRRVDADIWQEQCRS